MSKKSKKRSRKRRKKKAPLRKSEKKPKTALPPALEALGAKASDPKANARRIARYEDLLKRSEERSDEVRWASYIFAGFFTPVFLPGLIAAWITGQAGWGLQAILGVLLAAVLLTRRLADRHRRRVEKGLIKSFVAGFYADELRAGKRSPEQVLVLLEAAGLQTPLSELLPEVCSGRSSLLARLAPFPSFKAWMEQGRSSPGAAEALERVADKKGDDRPHPVLAALAWVQMLFVMLACWLGVGLALLTLIGAPLYGLYKVFARFF